MIKTTTTLLLTTAMLVACGGGSESVNLTPIEAAASPTLPPSEVANAAENKPMSDNDVFRLLQQGTYGPRRKDLDALVGTTPEAWIDAQMQTPATYLTHGLDRSNQPDRWAEYVNVWWRQVIQSDDQLRQRVAFALSQILVISGDSSVGKEQYGITNYYDILLRNSFGNYRDLLEEVTLNPVMGAYLSMKGNRKPDPDKNVQADENYARELMQLFTIGLEQLNLDGTTVRDADGTPVPTYDQNTIENYARVFTGWHYANVDNFKWPKHKDYITPMQAYEEYHDTDEKTLLNGLKIPAGQSAEQELKIALDSVFNHPNTAPFISKQLIQRLVTSNPSPDYVRDVAEVFNRNSAGERGSLASTVKAILMHKEAREGHKLYPTTFGKVKEPLMRVTQVWRAFEPDSIPNVFHYSWTGDELKQSPLNSPTVFNFFRPDYRQPGTLNMQDLKAPELQIIDESAIITITNRLLANSSWAHNYQSDPSSKHIVLNIDYEMQLQQDANKLLDHLDRVLLGGQMSPELRQITADLMDETYRDSQSVADAIFLISSSPEAAVQR